MQLKRGYVAIESTPLLSPNQSWSDTWLSNIPFNVSMLELSSSLDIMGSMVLPLE